MLFRYHPILISILLTLVSSEELAETTTAVTDVLDGGAARNSSTTAGGAALQLVMKGLAQLQGVRRKEWQKVLRSLENATAEDTWLHEWIAKEGSEDAKESNQTAEGLPQPKANETLEEAEKELAAILEGLDGRVRSVQERLRVSAERRANESAEGHNAARLLEWRLTRLEGRVQSELRSVFLHNEEFPECYATSIPTSATTVVAPTPTFSSASSSTPSVTTESQPTTTTTTNIPQSAPGPPTHTPTAWDLGRELLEAVEKLNVADVEKLLNAGADPNYVKPRDKFQWRALHKAANSDFDGAIVEALLRAEALVNGKTRKGNTPLHAAAMNNNEKATRLLLNNGASKTEKNNTGETPCDTAIKPSPVKPLSRVVCQLLCGDEADCGPSPSTASPLRS